MTDDRPQAYSTADTALEAAVNAGDLLIGITIAVTPAGRVLMGVNGDVEPEALVRLLLDAGARLGAEAGVDVAVFDAPLGGQG